MKQVTSLMMMLVAALSSAQLPSHRQTDWHHACSKTSFSNDTVYFSSFLKNEVDSDKAIEDALAFTAIKKGTLLIDKGTFYFSRTIQIPADVNIAGQGSENTHLVFNLKGNGHLLQIMGNNSAEKKWITTDAYRGETAIQVAANHNFNPGDWIKIGENNDELITSNWAKGSVHQIVQIKTVQGNTLLLKDALRLNISAEKQAYVVLFNPKENIALSGFHIIRQDKTIGQTANIFLSNAANIIIKNIQSDSCNFAHIQIEESSNVSINGCYLKTAFDYGNGGKAYGVALQFGTGNCLIENNIFARLRHSVLLQAGANGNVIGYNYSREPFWTETQFPSSLAGDIVLHGNAPFLNLFEGNICQNIVIDDSHGKNGDYNTFFRNRAEYYGLFMNNAPATDSQNFIGNEITGNGNVKVGMFSVPLGNYTISGSQHYEQFNLLPKAIIPQTSAPVIESSLYLNEQPNWWNPGMPFPFCGDRGSFNQNNNPAYWRYFFNSIKTADISNDTFKLKLNVTAEMDYLAINWYTTVTNPTRSFILYWKDEGHSEIELFSRKLSGAEKLRQVHYYFHDYRKHTSAKQYFKVNQVMTDGSIIQSEWIEIELQNISEPLLPSKLFYPNPANYEVTFNSNGHYKVYNMNGALIKEFDLDTPSEILVENWPRGIYTIIHHSGNQQLKERLIKN